MNIKRISQSPWIVMDLGLYSICCESCGKREFSALPLRMFAWIHQAAGFVRRHKDCGDPQRVRRFDLKKHFEAMAFALPPRQRDELLTRIAAFCGKDAPASEVTVHGAGQFADRALSALPKNAPVRGAHETRL